MTESEQTWETLCEIFGAAVAEQIVQCLDGAKVPTRFWLRRHLGLPRFRAMIEAGFSIRRASMRVGIAEGTGRAWKKELLRGDGLVTTQPQSETSEHRLQHRPEYPERRNPR